MLPNRCPKCNSSQYRDWDPGTGDYAIKCVAGHLNSYESRQGETTITVDNDPAARPWRLDGSDQPSLIPRWGRRASHYPSAPPSS